MTNTVRNPVFAWLYPRLAGAMEDRGVGEHRDALLSGLHGVVVEVGAGNGLNFAHYPTTVTTVTAIEPEPTLRALAIDTAADAPVSVAVADATADAVPAADDCFDAAVVSLVLCSVPRPATALAEIRRVLRPGGELRFYEHVRATTRWLPGVQDACDVVWPRIAAGCHTGRDSVAAIRAAGFTVTDCEAFDFPPSRLRVPTTPHVLGRAVLAG